MFFSCTSCGTRLQLPDEQVVNRILKIRCTACGAVMTVKDGITGKHQRPGETTWFVAVRGEQKGPLALAEVRALVDERRIDERSYVWTAGMDKWARAGEVQALAGLFAVEPPPLPVLGALGETAAVGTERAAPGGEGDAALAGGGDAAGLGPADGARSEAEALAAVLREAAEQAAREAEAAEAERAAAERAAAERAAAERAAAERQRAEAAEAERATEAERAAAIGAEPKRDEVESALDRSPPSASAPSPPTSVAPVASAPVAPVASVAPAPVVSAVAARKDIFDLSGLDAEDDPATARSGRSPEDMRAEMMALNQEFSVVARLEGSKKKRWIWIGVGVLAAGALVAILASRPADDELIVADVAPQKHKPYEAVERRAAQPRVETAPVIAEADVVGGAADDAQTGDAVQADATDEVARPARKVGLVVPPPQPKVKELTAERLAALTQDETGKHETRVVFDPGEASRKAADEAAARKAAATADALGEEVAAVFGKKKTQFAKCSDATQERVRVEFTVTPTGKTVGAKIDGTASDNKSRCIKAILDRSIFPAGDVELTYRQTLVL